jgi:hypothetical protein
MPCEDVLEISEASKCLAGRFRKFRKDKNT